MPSCTPKYRPIPILEPRRPIHRQADIPQVASIQQRSESSQHSRRVRSFPVWNPTTHQLISPARFTPQQEASASSRSHSTSIMPSRTPKYRAIPILESRRPTRCQADFPTPAGSQHPAAFRIQSAFQARAQFPSLEPDHTPTHLPGQVHPTARSIGLQPESFNEHHAIPHSEVPRHSHPGTPPPNPMSSGLPDARRQPASSSVQNPASIPSFPFWNPTTHQLISPARFTPQQEASASSRSHSTSIMPSRTPKYYPPSHFEVCHCHHRSFPATRGEHLARGLQTSN